MSGILQALLAHPDIASKHWIVRQYDHEVQGGSTVKPLTGPGQDGPSDAAVLRPKLGSHRGIALGSGLQTGLGEKTPGGDSYWMTLAALDEAVRNVVCVGADPGHIAVLDNFCWPRCDDERQLGSLVRAAEACYDGALAYRTPFVSGKDSLSNQFTTDDGKLITIPPTLLISALGIVPDVRRARTMDAKQPGNLLLLVGRTGSELGGSHYLAVTGDAGRNGLIPHVDLRAGPAAARAVAALIAAALVASAHDCSDGGLLVAAAEMAFAGGLGLDLQLDQLPAARELDDLTAAFAETPGRYLLEVEPRRFDAAASALRRAGVPFAQIGAFASHHRLTVRCARHGRLLDAGLDALRAAWLGPLDW
jgi:phosphoribosylformylglycinamidine synthase